MKHHFSAFAQTFVVGLTVIFCVLYHASAQAEDASGEKGVKYVPVVKCSFAGFNSLMAEVEAVGKLAEMPTLPDFFRKNFLLEENDNHPDLEFIQLATDGGLVGFCVFHQQEADDYAMAVIYKGTIEKWIAFVADSSGELTVEGREDGTTYVRQFGSGFYLRHFGEYTVGCSEESLLKAIPEDGVSLLEDLPSRYTVGGRVMVNNLPEKLLNNALGELLPIDDLDDALEELEATLDEDLSAEEAQLRKRMRIVRQKLWDYERSVNTVELGYRLDTESCEPRVWFQADLKENSPLAGLLAQTRALKPQFAATRYIGAMYHAHFIGVQEDLMRNLELAGLEKAESEIKKAFENEDFSEDSPTGKYVTLLAPPVLELLRGLAEQEAIEMAVAADVEIGGINAFFVTTIRDGAPMETLIKLAAKVMSEYPDFTKDIQLKLNVATANGFHFHQATMQLEDLFELLAPLRAGRYADKALYDESVKKIRRVFGETIELTIGVARDKIFIGYGPRCVEMLQKAMSSGSEGVPPPVADAGFSLEQCLAYYVAVYDIMAGEGPLSRGDRYEKNGFRMSANVLKTLPGAGNIRMEVRSVSDSRMVYELMAEKGVTKLLGSLPEIVNLQNAHQEIEDKNDEE